MRTWETQIPIYDEKDKWKEVLNFLANHNDNSKTLVEYQGFLKDFEVSQVLVNLAQSYGEVDTSIPSVFASSRVVLENPHPWEGFRISLDKFVDLPSALRIASLADGKETFGAWVPIESDGSLREQGRISVFMGDNKYIYNLAPIPNELSVTPLRNIVQSVTSRAHLYLAAGMREASLPSYEELEFQEQLPEQLVA